MMRYSAQSADIIVKSIQRKEIPISLRVSANIASPCRSDSRVRRDGIADRSMITGHIRVYIYFDAAQARELVVKRRYRRRLVVNCLSLLIVHEHQAWLSPTVLIIYDN